jgi:hypothetical protein
MSVSTPKIGVDTHACRTGTDRDSRLPLPRLAPGGRARSTGLRPRAARTASAPPSSRCSRSSRSGPLRPSAISPRSSAPTAPRSRATALVEEAGLVRIRVSDDARSRRVTITPKGGRTVRTAFPAGAKVQTSLSGSIGLQTADNLRRLSRSAPLRSRTSDRITRTLSLVVEPGKKQAMRLPRKNHTLPVVRHPGRGGGEVLLFHLPEFPDRKDQLLRKEGEIHGKKAGSVMVASSRSRGRNYRPQWRATFQVQRGRFRS